MTDSSQDVDNNLKSSYKVLVDKTATNLERQLVGIDIGTVTNGVLVPSRVNAANPIPMSGSVSIPGTVYTSTVSYPSGFHSYYSELFGFIGIETVQIGDPVTASLWDLTGGFGTVQSAPVSTVTTTKVSVANTGTTVITANTSRRLGFVQNISDTMIEIVMSNSITSGTACRIYPNEIFWLVKENWRYVGNIKAIHSAGVTKDVIVCEG